MQIIRQKTTDTFSTRLVRQSDEFLITSVIQAQKPIFQMHKLLLGDQPVSDIKTAKQIFSSHCAALIVGGHNAIG